MTWSTEKQLLSVWNARERSHITSDYLNGSSDWKKNIPKVELGMINFEAEFAFSCLLDRQVVLLFDLSMKLLS
jgi:hypothetical protein